MIIIIEIELLMQSPAKILYFHCLFLCHYFHPANALVFNEIVTSIDPHRGQDFQITPDWSPNILKSHNLRFKD